MKTYATLLLVAPVLVFGCSSKNTGTGGAGGGSTVASTHASTGTGTTTTTTSNTVATTATSSTGSGPIACSGSYTNIPVGDCDLLQQNCTNGNTCDIFQGTGGNSSVSMCNTVAPGLKAAGASCATEAECQKGLFCAGDVCTPACCPDSGEPCGGGSCDLKLTIMGTTDYVMVCDFSAQCTEFDPTSCASGYGCYPGNQTGLMTCGKMNLPTVPEGGTCTAGNDCDTMTVCLVNPSVCSMLCDPANPTKPPKMGGCPGTETCQPTNLGMFGMTGLCMP